MSAVGVRERTVASFAIAIVTVIVFAPALGNGFVPWDDDVNLLLNPHYRGLGWANLRWMATATRLDHWIPVTWLTFGVDYELWGMRPFGYHLTNVLFHALAAALMYPVARRLIGAAAPALTARARTIGALAAALAFAVHPLRVESVAWVTQRRDVVSGVLFLVTLLSYLVAAESTGARRTRALGVSLVAYALALASKSTVVALAPVLILLDVYPLRRLSPQPRAWRTPAARAVLAEKAAYLALALAGGLAELAAGHTSLTSLATLPATQRVAVVLYSVWFYVWKTAVPAALSPLYELPAQVDLGHARFLFAAVAVVAITIAALVLRRRWPAPLATWVAYVVVLLPVSGIVHNGFQLVSDRYSYLSCLPWAVLIGGGVAALLGTGEHGAIRRRLAVACTVVVAGWIVALAVVAHQETRVWHDGLTLWTRAVSVDPRCSICHANLGVALFNTRRYEPAVAEFREALALRPSQDFVRPYLGMALLQTAHAAEAAEQFETALLRYPGDAMLLTGLGIAMAGLGRPRDARSPLERAVTAKPDAPLAHFWLARVYATLGEHAKARAEAETVRALDGTLARQLDTVMTR